MMKEETQWNDAQIRFGPYNSNLVTTKSSKAALIPVEPPAGSSEDTTTATNNNGITDSIIAAADEEYDEYGAKLDSKIHHTDNTSNDRETFTFEFQVNFNSKISKHIHDDDEKKGEDDDENVDDTINKNKLDIISLTLKGYQSTSNITYCSTGLTMWPAANLICQYLVNNPTFLHGKRTLELGSGLGLCGLLAHRIVLGCKNDTDDIDHKDHLDHTDTHSSVVHLTDGDTDALFQLRQNIRQNIHMNNDNDKHLLSCHQLLWSKNNAETYLHHKANGEQFDVLLASDVIYAQSVVKPMWETVQVLLKERGCLLFAFARRQVAVTIKDVLEAGRLAGFECMECEESDPNENLFVYMFQRSHAGENNHDTN